MDIGDEYVVRTLPTRLYTILAVKKADHLNIKTKMASEYSLTVFASQPIRKRASKLFLC